MTLLFPYPWCLVGQGRFDVWFGKLLHTLICNLQEKEARQEARAYRAKRWHVMRELAAEVPTERKQTGIWSKRLLKMGEKKAELEEEEAKKSGWSRAMLTAKPGDGESQMAAAAPSEPAADTGTESLPEANRSQSSPSTSQSSPSRYARPFPGGDLRP